MKNLIKILNSYKLNQLNDNDYLKKCRFKNINFYNKVKSSCHDDKLVILHRRDINNLGDMTCTPELYFDFKIENMIDITRRNKIKEYVNKKHTFIIGGGGLLHSNEWMECIKYIIDNTKTVIWGIGKNIHYNNRNSNDKFIYPTWLRKAFMCGIRDYDQSEFEYIPCVSCMHEMFNIKSIPLHDFIVYNHKNHLIDKSANNSDFKRIDDCVKYLLTGKTIITSSYHGAYWAKLLGKNVIIKKKFSNKFDGLFNS